MGSRVEGEKEGPSTYPATDRTFLNLTEEPIAFSPNVTFLNGKRYRTDLPPGTTKFNKGGLSAKQAKAAIFTCPCGCGGVWVQPLEERTWNHDETSSSFHFILRSQFPCQWTGTLLQGVFYDRRSRKPE